jgi:uncharacterized protein YceK
MKWMSRQLVTFGLATLLATGITVTSSQAAAAFNDEYVYATTREVSEMNTHPGWKATLFPLTIALDTALLPFTVIAGFVTG